MSLQKGQILFEQGDQGGDLYFIQEGRVEIYQELEDREITLTEMGSGEVIGTLTCLSAAPRLASARALTEVVAKKVPRDDFQRMVKGLPSWMTLIIKDFVSRIDHMNELYKASLLEVNSLRKEQFTIFRKVAQFCSCIAAVGELLQKEIDEQKVFFLKPAVVFAERALGIEESEARQFQEILVKSGIIRAEIEPEKKELIVKLKSKTLIEQFSRFLSDAGRGRTKKFVSSHFRIREIRTLRGMIKYAKATGLDIRKRVEFSVEELENNMKSKVGQTFRLADLELAQGLDLIQVQKAGVAPRVAFNPQALGILLAQIDTYHQLASLVEKQVGSERVAV